MKKMIMLIIFYIFGILFSRYVDRQLRHGHGDLFDNFSIILWFIPFVNVMAPLLVFFGDGVYNSNRKFKSKFLNKLFNRDI